MDLTPTGRTGWPSCRSRRARAAACLFGLCAALAGTLWSPAGPAAADRVALVAEIPGAIGPATARFVERVLEQAAAREARLVVLQMDTPGGLSDSMREIIQAIIGSPVPVATHVFPSGARAASAGTYILYASHVAAMAPGTNLGAATPVHIGPGLPLPGRGKPAQDDDQEGEGGVEPAGSALERKSLNDAIAYIRGLAELRGRNVEWAEAAVREAASLPAGDAVEQGVVDFVAADLSALLAQADGRTVDMNGTPLTLATAGLAVERVQPSWQLRALAIITNPNVAFLLLMIGMYGLIFEFSNPGAIGPGVVGLICLLLGAYALNMLPLDYTGLALVVIGIAFMVAEAFTPTFGVLGLGGVTAFALGASMLVDSDSPAFRISVEMIAVSALASAALLVLVLGYALRAQRRLPTTGDAEVLDSLATVLEWHDGEGFVQVRGERWRARARATLRAGQQVPVTAVDGLTLELGSPAPETPGD